MPRSLIFGNGSLLATFDAHLQMRDLYFPHVGMEDHTTYGHVHRVGVFVEEKGFSWLDNPEWTIGPKYMPETLVGNSALRNDRLGIAITVEDCIHPIHNVLLRSFHVRSTDGQSKSIRLFFNHDFHIYGDKQSEPEFHRLVCFGKLAEFTANRVKKGTPLYVEGRLHTGRWESKNGEARTSTEIIVDRLVLLSGRSRGPGEAAESDA